jgi:heat-inducible transcriptional repressor
VLHYLWYLLMITSRQQQLLSAIIEQYAEVASPVGSVTLAKAFAVSPATIRAEMARLEEMGYIAQPHTSAGRVPTDKGYRHYVNQLSSNQLDQGVEEPRQQLGATRVLDKRVEHAGRPELAIRSAVDSLVEMTHNLGLATIGTTLYMSGMSNLFSQPEFSGGAHVRGVAQLLDNLEPWLAEAAPNEPLSVYIGRENPIGKSSGCTLIISRFNSPYSDRSYIGILGSTRQSYSNVMRLVAHAGKVLEDSF